MFQNYSYSKRGKKNKKKAMFAFMKCTALSYCDIVLRFYLYKGKKKKSKKLSITIN